MSRVSFVRGVSHWLLMTALAACQATPTPTPSTTTVATRRGTSRPLLLHWLHCYECTDGELDSVVALGTNPQSADATIDSLARDLYAGPSPKRRENVHFQLDSSYIEDSTDAAADGGPIFVTRKDYVAPLLDNYINVYRVRAARALAQIGGPAAKAALDSVLAGARPTPADSLRADAFLAVKFARDSILGP